MRIIFMGTPQFAVPSLRALVENGYPPVAVVTGPDRGRGRGQKMSPTAVKKAAIELNIDTILQPESVRDASFAEDIAALEPDVLVVVAFKILPPEVYEQASIGAFNLHASLLPKYRGAAPINWAIMRGESTSGVTTFLLQKEVDRGDILLKKSVTISPDDTAGDLHDRLMEIGAEAVVETVQLLEQGDFTVEVQKNDEATSAPKIFTDDCQIPWHRDAESVHNHIRGLSPYPGAWTMHGDTRLKVYKSSLPVGGLADHSLSDAAESAKPGTVLQTEEDLVVACDEGAVHLDKIQQPGKQKLSAAEFLRGYYIEPGAKLA